jgi:hypothetical protein
MIFHHRQEIYDKLEEISSQISQIKIIKIKTKGNFCKILLTTWIEFADPAKRISESWCRSHVNAKPP